MVDHADPKIEYLQTEFTDNREPPMSTVYWGILDTGTNRYAHPASEYLLVWTSWTEG